MPEIAWFGGRAPSTLGRVNGTTKRIVTRCLADADLDAVVTLSLAAWAPVFASLEEQLGTPVFRMIYPDWTQSQAAAVRAVCPGCGTTARCEPRCLGRRSTEQLRRAGGCRGKTRL